MLGNMANGIVETEGTQIANQLNLKRLSNGSRVIIRALNCKKGKEKSECHSNARCERFKQPLLILKMEETTCLGTPKASSTGKGKGTDFPLGLPERNTVRPTL